MLEEQGQVSNQGCPKQSPRNQQVSNPFSQVLGQAKPSVGSRDGKQKPNDLGISALCADRTTEVRLMDKSIPLT